MPKICTCRHVCPYSNIFLSKYHINPSKYVDTVTICAYLDHLGSITSDDPTWPWRVVEVIFVPIPPYPFVQVPWKSIKYVDTVTSGIARAFLGGVKMRTKNEESLRRNNKQWWNFEENEESGTIAHGQWPQMTPGWPLPHFWGSYVFPYPNYPFSQVPQKFITVCGTSEQIFSYG